MDERLSKNRLEEIASLLSGRDKAILFSVRQCRYLTTRQIQQLHVADAANPISGLKATNRNLNKLNGLGLIDVLARRIGGVRAGSGARIWHVTDGGERLLRLLGHNIPRSRKRSFEPSIHFLRHTLAAAECYVQLSKLCAGDGLKLVSFELEPDCWRSYSRKGKLITLRPDLFAVTNCGDYEDRWFIEIDLDTEAPVTVVEKCRRYHDYYRSGQEQKHHEVFPLVVWIVPDDARKHSVTVRIRDEFKELRKIFVVITPNELEPLIRQGVESGALC